MHRRVAAFAAVGGCWFVANLMEAPKRITVAGRDAGGLGPRFVSDEAELPPGRLRLSFRIGANLRHIDVDVPARGLTIETGTASDRSETDTIANAPKIELSPSQRLLAVAMAELRLMDPTTSSPLPSKADVMARLRWGDKQYDNHLDALCLKLQANGVEGVVGEGKKKAFERRENSVDFLIETRTIDFDDLGLLPPD